MDEGHWLAASAQRLGWQVGSFKELITVEGRLLDLTLDPPVIIRRECESMVGIRTSDAS